MTAYYNEFDPYAAAWLRNLISAGRIAPGDVDERSILDVRPDDLRGYTQCHFFAGIGVWSAALRGAGWPDDRPVWTGSCPCQPFSAAGKGAGFADERHLWPYWHYLIEQCRPAVVFGEQVASKDGLGWLDLVQADMEGTDYAFWPVDLCAAGVGAPHIRQRLWFVGERLDDTTGARHFGAFQGAEGHPRDEARLRLPCQRCGLIELANTAGVRREQQRCAEGIEVQGVCAERSREHSEPDETRELSGGSEGLGGPCGVADAGVPAPERQRPDSREVLSVTTPEGSYARGNPISELADTDGARYAAPLQRSEQASGQGDERAGASVNRGGVPDAESRPGPTNGHWRDADWLFCRDGKWRPVEPGTFPLAHGAASRVGRLRAYGNAIVRQAAEAIIACKLERDAERFRLTGLSEMNDIGGIFS